MPPSLQFNAYIWSQKIIYQNCNEILLCLIFLWPCVLILFVNAHNIHTEFQKYRADFWWKIHVHFFTKDRPIKQQRLTNEISLVERFFYIVIISLYRLYIFVKNNSILTKYGTTLHTRPKQRKIIKEFQLQRF